MGELTADALELIEEYQGAVGVTVRDSVDDLRGIAARADEGIWVAYRGSRAVGCVVLRRLHAVEGAGECKRLYVRPEVRGLGVADALMDAEEAYAHSIGLQWIYLDSKDDLKAAIALYRRRGYEECARYNANPQATVFMRKRLGSG